MVQINHQMKSCQTGLPAETWKKFINMHAFSINSLCVTCHKTMVLFKHQIQNTTNIYNIVNKRTLV